MTEIELEAELNDLRMSEKAMALLEHVGTPKVYGTFSNGYVYEFIEGEPLNAARLRSDRRLLRLAGGASGWKRRRAEA